MPETESVKKETTSIKVDPDRWKEVKIEAIRQNKTVSDLVMEAIAEWMKAHRKK
ncbi:MAG: hypothetical protein ABSF82_07850 [Candidatus Bathyarchaeia archaeon]